MTSYRHCCVEMQEAVSDPELPIRFVAKFREFGIDIQDGGSSYKLIAFCPWCGTKLPTSLREQWFDSLESQGIDPASDETIPENFQNSGWYLGQQ